MQFRLFVGSLRQSGERCAGVAIRCGQWRRRCRIHVDRPAARGAPRAGLMAYLSNLTNSERAIGLGETSETTESCVFGVWAPGPEIRTREEPPILSNIIVGARASTWVASDL